MMKAAEELLERSNRIFPCNHWPILSKCTNVSSTTGTWKVIVFLMNDLLHACADYKIKKSNFSEYRVITKLINFYTM